MQLCIDQGNSSVKIAVFDGDTLVCAEVYNELSSSVIEDLYGRYDIRYSIFSTVAAHNKLVINELIQRSKVFIELTHDTPVPLQNKYLTPHTLGKDRLAAVVGAMSIHPGTDILVVDAGSAITFDFADRHGCYWGGNISPGVDMRLRALHQFTDRLPFVEMQEESRLLGNDTQSAILSGVLVGVRFEIDGYINQLKNEYPQLSTFLTGGNTFYFANRLKNAIFAEKNLVLIGLNRILLHNV